MRTLALLLVVVGCKKTEEALPGGVVVDERPTAPEPPKTPTWERNDLSKTSGLNVDATKLAKQPAVADAGGTPIFAWVEGVSVHVARWKNAGASFDGNGSFEMLGPINRRPDRQGTEPRLALDKDGNLFAAWIEMDPDDRAQLEVARRTGEQWTSLGNPNTTKGYSPAKFDFAISSEGPVVVIAERAWTDQKVRLLFRRFDGKAWSALGDGAAIAVGAGDELREAPALSAAPTHPPLVAWKERKPDGALLMVAKRWDPAKGSWLDVDAPAGADGDSSVDADMGADGATYLWMTKNVGVTSVMRLDPTSTRWTDLGVPACGGSAQSTFDVAGGVAVLATDASLCAWTHDGGWKLIGDGFSANGHQVRDAVIAGSNAGPIFVAWQDASVDPAVIRAVAFR